MCAITTDDGSCQEKEGSMGQPQVDLFIGLPSGLQKPLTGSAFRRCMGQFYVGGSNILYEQSGAI